ncbi:MAG: HlyC/CorC family transporter [Geobacter sp.]|nr:HlyC/CorC family transporter [Geobacter sp.]
METVFLELFIIAVLVVLNGFFSCSEFAIVSIRKSRVAQLVAEGDVRAKALQELQHDPHRVLALVQIGVTVVGSTASAIGGIIAVEHLKPYLVALPLNLSTHVAETVAISIVVILISYVTLIVGELAPKTIGLQYADIVALRVARSISLMARVATVAVTVLTASSKGFLALFGIKGTKREFVTREEIRHIVSEGHKAGEFSAYEEQFIKNIFDFTHTYVREVMVPRPRIIGLDLDKSREELIETVLEHQYSRYPVFREHIENIVGFIHGKDLMGRMVSEPGFDIVSIIRPPFYVPEQKRVSDLLKEMQRKRGHMALVVDEYGSISGIVTTEDLLEELVGEITDEHDVGEPRTVRKLRDGSWLVDALLSINDLEDLLNIKLGEDLPYDTLAGLILHELGRIPERGEKLVWNSYELMCAEVKKTAIVKVRIKKLGSGTGD